MNPESRIPRPSSGNDNLPLVVLFLLSCILAGLKVTGHIDVSWIVVFAPALLIPVSLVAFFLAFVIGAVATLLFCAAFVLLETIADCFRK